MDDPREVPVSPAKDTRLGTPQGTASPAPSDDRRDSSSRGSAQRRKARKRRASQRQRKAAAQAEKRLQSSVKSEVHPGQPQIRGEQQLEIAHREGITLEPTEGHDKAFQVTIGTPKPRPPPAPKRVPRTAGNRLGFAYGGEADAPFSGSVRNGAARRTVVIPDRSSSSAGELTGFASGAFKEDTSTVPDAPSSVELSSGSSEAKGPNRRQRRLAKRIAQLSSSQISESQPEPVSEESDLVVEPPDSWDSDDDSDQFLGADQNQLAEVELAATVQVSEDVLPEAALAYPLVPLVAGEQRQDLTLSEACSFALLVKDLIPYLTTWLNNAADGVANTDEFHILLWGGGASALALVTFIRSLFDPWVFAGDGLGPEHRLPHIHVVDCAFFPFPDAVREQMQQHYGYATIYDDLSQVATFELHFALTRILGLPVLSSQTATILCSRTLGETITYWGPRFHGPGSWCVDIAWRVDHQSSSLIMIADVAAPQTFVFPLSWPELYEGSGNNSALRWQWITGPFIWGSCQITAGAGIGCGMRPMPPDLGIYPDFVYGGFPSLLLLGANMPPFLARLLSRCGVPRHYLSYVELIHRQSGDRLAALIPARSWNPYVLRSVANRVSEQLSDDKPVQKWFAAFPDARVEVINTTGVYVMRKCITANHRWFVPFANNWSDSAHRSNESISQFGRARGAKDSWKPSTWTAAVLGAAAVLFGPTLLRRAGNLIVRRALALVSSRSAEPDDLGPITPIVALAPLEHNSIALLVNQTSSWVQGKLHLLALSKRGELESSMDSAATWVEGGAKTEEFAFVPWVLAAGIFFGGLLLGARILRALRPTRPLPRSFFGAAQALSESAHIFVCPPGLVAQNLQDHWNDRQYLAKLGERDPILQTISELQMMAGIGADCVLAVSYGSGLFGMSPIRYANSEPESVFDGYAAYSPVRDPNPHLTVTKMPSPSEFAILQDDWLARRDRVGWEGIEFVVECSAPMQRPGNSPLNLRAMLDVRVLTNPPSDPALQRERWGEWSAGFMPLLVEAARWRAEVGFIDFDQAREAWLKHVREAKKSTKERIFSALEVLDSLTTDNTWTHASNWRSVAWLCDFLRHSVAGVTVFMKADEVLLRRAVDPATGFTVSEMKPRSIVAVDPYIVAVVGPYVYHAHMRLKELWSVNPTPLFLTSLTAGPLRIRITYSSGLSDIDLARWASLAEIQSPGTASIIVGGDDSAIIIVLRDGRIVSLMGDFGFYDQSQGLGPLNFEYEVLTKVCGVPEIITSIMREVSYAAINVSVGQQAAIQIKRGQLGAQRCTGGADTTLGNSIVNVGSQVMCAYDLLEAATMFADGKADEAEDLIIQSFRDGPGFKMKPKFIKGVAGLDFLKGWFVPIEPLAPSSFEGENEEDWPVLAYMWSPLPSRVLKAGKSLSPLKRTYKPAKASDWAQKDSAQRAEDVSAAFLLNQGRSLASFVLLDALTIAFCITALAASPAVVMVQRQPDFQLPWKVNSASQDALSIYGIPPAFSGDKPNFARVTPVVFSEFLDMIEARYGERAARLYCDTCVAMASLGGPGFVISALFEDLACRDYG